MHFNNRARLLIGLTNFLVVSTTINDQQFQISHVYESLIFYLNILTGTEL